MSLLYKVEKIKYNCWSWNSQELCCEYDILESTIKKLEEDKEKLLLSKKKTDQWKQLFLLAQ